MSRSPLAYPLTRGIDGDSGGAADLQTDIMRFMAILALCLLAIFALVQSIPLTPQLPIDTLREEIPVIAEVPSTPLVKELEQTLAATPSSRKPTPPVSHESPESNAVVLTRPRWQSQFMPIDRADENIAPVEVVNERPVSQERANTKTPNSLPGFTLRFENDLALTRLVAAGQVALYAIDAGRAQRMTVSDSRISFWQASIPNAFHEMEVVTVPQPVIEALARSGTDTRSVNWGVTLPGNLRNDLDRLMRKHRGGELIIGADGSLNLDAS